jgi:UDP-galactose transporter B1
MASNGGLKQKSSNGVLDEKALLQRQVDGLAMDRSSSGSAQTTKNLVICVGGIYASLYASSIPRDTYMAKLTIH